MEKNNIHVVHVEKRRGFVSIPPLFSGKRIDRKVDNPNGFLLLIGQLFNRWDDPLRCQRLCSGFVGH